MKNFFEHQDEAKRTTTYLIFLFGCAITFTILAMYAACILIARQNGVVQSSWQPAWLGTIALSICLIVAFGSFRKMTTLRGGGKVVAQGLGGQLVGQDTSNPQERELLNVVEEMAIAAGIAVPEVYLLPEASINAFAAGLTANTAVIGVTQGSLTQLNRDQLQGVIGHEFSHIVNGDMALNMKLMGLVHGLLFIHLIGRSFLFSSHRRHTASDRDKQGGAWLAFACSMTVIGAIGWIFGQMIKSAVSRQREFLADASAVQFTRNPAGIADALRCIAQQSKRSQISSTEAEAASHLFFNNVSALSSFASAFSTHPPLAERIRRLGSDAAIGTSSPARTQAANRSLAGITEGASPATLSSHNPIEQRSSAMAISSFAAADEVERSTDRLEAPNRLAPDALVADIGIVTPAHLTQAQSLLKHLPQRLLQAVRAQTGAVAVCYGLLLDPDTEVRSRQKQIIADSSRTVYDLLEKIEPLLEQVSVRSRLPLIELCIPALKQLKPEVAAQFFIRVKALIKADGKLSLNEFALQSVLQYRLATYFKPEQTAAERASQLTDVWSDSLLLISALAKAGQTQHSQIDYAFRCGIQQLPGVTKQTMPADMPTCTLSNLSKALRRLRQAEPKLKRAIAQACAHTVLIDGHTTDQEAELLRAILITLGCPVPPFLNLLPAR
ncbi:M48 family metallopeptidase [cf. Phormidesmis sp. LEGE 11477]|uniref:M48 family metallopeptidase n=1 Tax=cf. Phormidesmis sp. LEGE 11477 TaxID=1828680 RepID=UPI00187EC989|nr:M48 family metallopeptidase [cf. Phormidesmis sp. LEGE 11477]MBE9062937.1 M48 family metallopeptidase [cf. Phormidesmis sp. LEGE 11477]